MKTLRSLFRPAATVLLAASMLVPILAPASSAGRAEPRPEMSESEMLLAQSGDCYSIGQSIAAEHDGTVARADAAKRGGQNVCVIVVVVPARDGQRGRRLEFVVPN